MVVAAIDSEFFSPGDAKRTPQQIQPGQRRCYGKQRRARLIRAQADAIISAHGDQRRAGAVGPPGTAFVAAAETMLGKPYRITGCRCEPGCCCEDCSGEVCLAANLIGLPHICTTSFAIAISVRELGLVTTFTKAIFTPGAILIRGPHNGEGPANGPSGSNGHIVICKGDGRTTVEAKGRAYGIVRGSVFGRGFDDSSIGRAAFFPGVNYAVLTPREDVMFIQAGAAVPAGRKKTIGLSDDRTHVELWNGANVVGMDAVWPGDPSNLRRYYPKAGDGTLFAPAGRTYKGIAEHLDKGGLTCTRDDGATVDGYYPT